MIQYTAMVEDICMGSKVQHLQLEPWSQLDGKIIMVTGASSGLGRELCLSLATANCRILAAARRIGHLESLCDQINKMDDIPTINGASGGTRRAIAVELNVTADDFTIEARLEKAWGAFGHIDALVNNAGVRGQNTLSLEFPKEEFSRVMNTNLMGSWVVSKYIGARMRDGGRGGSIINISSLSGFSRTQSQGAVAYGASKAALDSMTRVMALELGGYNIRVNAIIPGIFKSEITENLLKKSGFKSLAEKITPLRTNGTTDPALTTLVRYLIHDSSNYISGNIFIADAGISLPGTPIFSSL